MLLSLQRAIYTTRFIVVVAALTLTGCSKQSQALPDGAKVRGNGGVWGSKHTPVNIGWEPPWRYLKATDTVDSSERVRVAFINKDKSSTFVLEITPDIDVDVLSQEEYLTAVKEQQLQFEDAKLELEDSVTKCGLKFDRMCISRNGTKGGINVQVLVNRDGDRAIVLMFVYPKTDQGEWALPRQFDLLNIDFETKANSDH